MLWLLTLLACGRDDILVAADEHAAAARAGSGTPGVAPDEAAPGGNPGYTPGVAPDEAAPGRPSGAAADPGGAQPLPGVPVAPGTPGAAGTPGVPVAGSQGVPTEPTPVIVADPKPAPPGTPQPNAGPQIIISGTVTFSTYKAGDVRITVFDGDHSKPSTSPPRVLGMAEIAGPGAFSVAVPENVGKVYIEGSIDEDGDGRPGPQEPAGKADRYPLTVGVAAIKGVAVELNRIAPPPSGEHKGDF